jgi:hypothetical protein
MEKDEQESLTGRMDALAAEMAGRKPNNRRRAEIVDEMSRASAKEYA